METMSSHIGALTIAVRVSAETGEQLQALARAEDRSVSELASRAIEEYIRQARFPGIRFMNTPTGERKAVLRSGHSVWGVVFNARGFAMEAQRTAAHLEVPVESVRLALDYYAAYPIEIDEHLARLEELPEDLHPIIPSAGAGNVTDPDDAPAS
jgi:hypothetical protein